MKRVFTFSGTPAVRALTCADLKMRKGTEQKLTMVNPRTVDQASACVEAGIDILTVYDHLLEDVRAVAPTSFLVGGMGWDEYATKDEILRAAINAMSRGADMYYTTRSFDIIEMLANESIPVEAHIGLVPAFSTWTGGLRAVGKTADEAMQLYRTMKRLENAGCFAVEIECVAEETMKLLSQRTSLVTVSMGSGHEGDVIFLFLQDICGETVEPPRHARAFGDVNKLHRQITEIESKIQSERIKALRLFKASVMAGEFPGKDESIGMTSVEKEKLLEALYKEA